MADYVRCPMCWRHCITGILALTEIPKDSEVKIPGKTPEGVEVNDIRPYCTEHYVKP